MIIFTSTVKNLYCCIFRYFSTNERYKLGGGGFEICNKSEHRGGGVKKSGKIANVIYGWPLKLHNSV